MKRLIIIDALSFQLLWFIAVQGNDLFAVLAAFAHLLLFHLLRAVTRHQWYFIITVTFVGGLIDTLIGTTNIIVFHGVLTISVHDWAWQIAPLWLWCLWCCFAATLLRSLYWLRDRLFLAAIIGACAGPLSYWAGAAFSGSTFEWPTPHVLGLEAVLWAMLLPALLWVARHTPNQAEVRSYAPAH